MIGTGSLTNSQVAALAAATMIADARIDFKSGYFDAYFDHILSKLNSVKPTADTRTFGDA